MLILNLIFINPFIIYILLVGIILLDEYLRIKWHMIHRCSLAYLLAASTSTFIIITMVNGGTSFGYIIIHVLLCLDLVILSLRSSHDKRSV